MKIAINLLGIMPSIGGAYNYVENLVRSIEKYDNANEYIIFVTIRSKQIVKPWNKAKIITCRIDSKYRILRIIYENTVIPFLAKYYEADKMLWPTDTIGFVNSVPSIVINHDFLGIVSPKNYSILKRLYLRIALKNTLKRAQVFLPISEATSKELRSLTNRKLGDLKVLPNILDYSFKRSSENRVSEFRKKYNLYDKFWLYVAHYYPHKNHKNLLAAYALLKSINPDTYKLVLRGDGLKANSEILGIINDLKLSSDVILLDRVESDELAHLYSAAEALIFPSLYEGGGIPIMEAMACGCPVVASKIPTTLEFAGNSALLFDPKSVNSMVNTMNKFQLNELMKECLTKNGYESIKKLRPEGVVSTLISSYCVE